MSYEPTVWKDGDVITAEKMNKLEQGVKNEQVGPERRTRSYRSKEGPRLVKGRCEPGIYPDCRNEISFRRSKTGCPCCGSSRRKCYEGRI